MIKQLDSGYLHGWVSGLILNQTVIGPVEDGKGQFVFEPIANASQLRLDYDVTVLPPKKFLLPPHEVLVHFQQGKYSAPPESSENFMLFGVHPYDVIGIRQLDKVFSETQKDTQYMQRRSRFSIVMLDAENISPNNFAGSIGTAEAKDGWDLRLTRVGDNYLAEARTEKGEQLMHFLGPAPEATKEQLDARLRQIEEQKLAAQKWKLKCAPEDLGDLLERNYDHPIWQELATKCLTCGACNVVCPTCYCFDMQDEVDWNLESGTRCRAWDGCLLREFASVAGGHNFRKQSAERFRHRFYRKAKYLPGIIGELACVGCGRCISACIPKISNPVALYNTLLGD